MSIELLSAIAAVGSSVAAVLAWLAKLWWGKEFAAAKDEVIKAKEAHIQMLEKEMANLKDLTPMKIREYFTSVRLQLEEYIETLKNDLEKAHGEIATKNNEINELQQIGGDRAAKIQTLEEEKSKIEEATKLLENNLKLFNKDIWSHKKEIWHNKADAVNWLFFVEPKSFDNVNNSWRNLKNYIAHEDSINHNINIKIFDDSQQRDHFSKLLHDIWSSSKDNYCFYNDFKKRQEEKAEDETKSENNNDQEK